MSTVRCNACNGTGSRCQCGRSTSPHTYEQMIDGSMQRVHCRTQTCRGCGGTGRVAGRVRVTAAAGVASHSSGCIASPDTGGAVDAVTSLGVLAAAAVATLVSRRRR